MQNLEQNQNQEDRLSTTNMMQIGLAQLRDESLENFIKFHAKTFRETLDAHPELIDEFKNNPNATLNKLKDTIH